MALPINQEGPLFYWRKDIFERCKIAEPQDLEDIPAAAAAIKACDANQGAWAARGIRGVTPYAMAAFVYNSGGSFTTPDGKPGLSQPNSVKGLAMYANLLKDYGPPGALNHTFTQVIELLGQGRVAMTHESSNEFANIMRFPDRANDLGVKVLPPGKETGISKPVAIGWTVAISAYSKRQPAAWLFLQWATSPEVQSKLVQAGVAPPRASVFGGEALKTWAAEMPIRKAWADALIEIGRTGTGVYQSPTDRIPEARDIIGGAMQQIVLGKASPHRRPRRRPTPNSPSCSSARGPACSPWPAGSSDFRWMAAPAVIFAAGMIAFPTRLCGVARAERRDARLRAALRGLRELRRLFADDEFWNGLRLTLVLYASRSCCRSRSAPGSACCWRGRTSPADSCAP